MSYEIPKFKIIWRHGPTIGILFNDQLSDSQIEQIIYELREIRKRKEFDKYFPATTPQSRDKYSQIYIEIFTDPKWATEGIMKDFIFERMSEEMVKEYLNNTRGYYGWSQEYKYEGGSLGNVAGELASENCKHSLLNYWFCHSEGIREDPAQWKLVALFMLLWR